MQRLAARITDLPLTLAPSAGLCRAATLRPLVGPGERSAAGDPAITSQSTPENIDPASRFFLE